MAIPQLTWLQFSLSLELEPRSSSEMLIRATFKDNMLPISQASLLLEQYEAVLNDVLNRPDSHISDAGRIRNELLSITPAEEPTLESPVELLHEFVEHQAKSQPDKTAFEFLHRDKHGHLVCANWNYEQLNTEGDKIASFLRHRDIEAGSYVGICFEKCPEASFAMLGILKAGCAYVALDPSAPPARKSFIAQDSNIAMLLTSSQQSRSLEDVITSAPIVYVNEISAEQSRPGSGRPHVPTLPPHSVCYCLYTSGTTGTPKGCEITHHNAVQAMRAFSKLFQGRWDANSRWLQFASFHFDVSVLEQYWTWSEGLCVVSAPRDLIFEDLEATIQGMGITHIDLTPSLAALVKPANVPSLCKGVFITGGEQLKQEILDVWGEQEVIHNGYGPTETTIGVTMCTRVPKNGKPANIGKQFANVGTYVLQPGMMTPVLRGAIGELCIAGNLVGKGYLNRRDLTAEKFPYVAEYGERIYRTGDLVRICHDQSFLFIGRVDDQVKLRGQRLEIGEINSTIRKAVPAIADVATFVLRHPKQQRDQLVTFFTSSVTPNHEDPIVLDASSGNRAALGKARDSCTEQLPGYMVPTFFIPVTRMPLSTNNKTDAKILKQLYCEASIEELQNLVVVDESFLSNSEKSVADVLSIYCQVPIEHIRPTSNILELGLDSISVLGFCSKLKKAGFRTATAGLVLSSECRCNLARFFTYYFQSPLFAT
jgi:amino acid adenylation domain-containing protein